MLVWFDPDSEEPSLRALTGEEKAARVDNMVSVRGLDRDKGQLPLRLTIKGGS